MKFFFFFFKKKAALGHASWWTFWKIVQVKTLDGQTRAESDDIRCCFTFKFE